MVLAPPGGRRQRVGPTAGGVLSCVVDTDPRFHLEVLRWYVTATSLAGVAPEDLRVHVIPGGPTDVIAHLRSNGVVVREIAPYDARSAHCNKIAGARALCDDAPERAVLTDTDLAFLADPRAIEVPTGAVALKSVDAVLPPLAVLEGVFAAAGVAAPPRVHVDNPPEGQTLRGNGNGGLIVVPGTVLDRVVDGWDRWARWLLERITLLGEWHVHVDQVAFGLALAADRTEVALLPARWNTPTHLGERGGSGGERPAVLHYHRHVDQIGRLLATGVAAVDEAIDEVNATVGASWGQFFPNEAFWEWRYRTNPELGSGVGSRGTPLADKRALIAAVAADVRPASVLDVGCGDGEATRGLELPGYTGMDLSAEAVGRAAQGRPEGTYLVGDLGTHHVRADLVLCLDVLIHQSDPARYRATVRALLEAAGSALLVSGYDAPPSFHSPMTHFHEALRDTLLALDPACAPQPLRVEHDIVTYYVPRAMPRRGVA